MKRKIKLRGELVIIMLFSLVISFAVAFGIRDYGLKLSKNSEKTREKKLYSECLNELETKLVACDLESQEQLKSIFEESYNYLVGYSFYVVNEEGKVLISNNEVAHTISQNEIVDGKRNYSVSREDSNIFRFEGCDYLKDSYYLIYSYLMYDENDTGMVAEALVGALVCFFILSWRRISYISAIKEGVDQMAAGRLEYRVPSKYKNELRELADGINHMATVLESEEQRKNEFLTNISHDIRTPLTTILGYLDMLKKEKYDTKEEMIKYLSIMERKGRFLAFMLEDFFQYSKLVSGDIKVQREKFELNELLRQIYEEEVETFKEKQLELKLQLNSEPILYTGDIMLIARVVNNLLSNALKYSKSGTHVWIKSSVFSEGSLAYPVFSVSNVPKEKLRKEEIDRLFERLYKRDAARGGEGSGLGLSIASHIVKLHDGRISTTLGEEEFEIKVQIR